MYHLKRNLKNWNQWCEIPSYWLHNRNHSKQHWEQRITKLVSAYNSIHDQWYWTPCICLNGHDVNWLGPLWHNIWLSCCHSISLLKGLHHWLNKKKSNWLTSVFPLNFKYTNADHSWQLNSIKFWWVILSWVSQMISLFS